MKRCAVAVFATFMWAGSTIPAHAAPNLRGEWTCLTYGVSINWFQNLWFKGPGAYALGESRKPYDAGTYRIDGRNVIDFLSGGDKDFLGKYKGGAIYLKFKSDKGPFEKRGFDLTFKCGRNSH